MPPLRNRPRSLPRDSGGKFAVQEWRDLLRPPAGVFLAILVLLLAAGVNKVVTPDPSRTVVGILIATLGVLIPFAYFGRAHSLRDDVTVLRSRRLDHFDALSTGEVPRHPSWWRERGEPARPYIHVAIFASLLVSPLSLAVATYFHVEYAILGWPTPLVVLWWARSTRRQAFAEHVDALAKRSSLRPGESERARLRQKIADLRGLLAKLEELRDADGDHAAYLKLSAELDRHHAELHSVLKGREDRDARDRRLDRRRDVVIALAGLVAGVLLNIVTSSFGLT